MTPEPRDPARHGINWFLVAIGLGYIAVALYMWNTRD